MPGKLTPHLDIGIDPKVSLYHRANHHWPVDLPLVPDPAPLRGLDAGLGAPACRIPTHVIGMRDDLRSSTLDLFDADRVDCRSCGYSADFPRRLGADVHYSRAAENKLRTRLRSSGKTSSSSLPPRSGSSPQAQSHKRAGARRLSVERTRLRDRQARADPATRREVQFRPRRDADCGVADHGPTPPRDDTATGEEQVSLTLRAKSRMKEASKRSIVQARSAARERGQRFADDIGILLALYVEHGVVFPPDALVVEEATTNPSCAVRCVSSAWPTRSCRCTLPQSTRRRLGAQAILHYDDLVLDVRRGSVLYAGMNLFPPGRYEFELSVAHQLNPYIRSMTSVFFAFRRATVSLSPWDSPFGWGTSVAPLAEHVVAPLDHPAASGSPGPVRSWAVARSSWWALIFGRSEFRRAGERRAVVRLASLVRVQRTGDAARLNVGAVRGASAGRLYCQNVH